MVTNVSAYDIRASSLLTRSLTLDVEETGPYMAALEHNAHLLVHVLVANEPSLLVRDITDTCTGK